MPMIIAAIIAAAGSAIGAALAAGDRAKARQIQEDAAARVNAIMPAQFKRITPEEIGQSAFEDMQVPDEGRNAQLQALAALTDTVSNKGNDAQFQEDWRTAQEMMGRQNAALRGAAQNYAAARGLGPQANYIAQLSEAQNSANNAADMASKAAAMKQQRYLEALRGLSSAGGALNDADYKRSSDRAQAMDYLNRFNATQRTNAANANNQLAQWRFQNDMAKATGQMPANMAQAAGYGSDAVAAQQTGTTLGAGGAGIIDMFDEYLREQEKKKNDDKWI